jgi:hypothetical protein
MTWCCSDCLSLMIRFIFAYNTGCRESAARGTYMADIVSSFLTSNIYGHIC